MTCDLCQKNEATVHLTEIINDQSRELHLCETCAREKGPKAAQDFGLADMLAGLADFGTKMETGTKAKLACPQCKLTYEDFRKSGRLGCSNCYQTFHRFLEPLLRRIHGSAQHIGKKPTVKKSSAASMTNKKTAGLSEEISRLREQLKKAVAEEIFEEAVRLRDQIRALEGKPKRRSKDGDAG